MTDLVAAAATAVDYDTWTTTDDGELIPQITTDTTIHSMLRMLDLRPGMRVMEIGTGSGYSGAVLSRIVGTDGHVVSIDIDADLVERARRRHEQAASRNVELHTADGFAGWAASGPFDRIVGWVTPHVLPAAWVEQAKTDAVIVSPVKIANVAGANAVLRCVINDGPRDGQLHPGSFIEMAPEVITEVGLPLRYVDAVHRQLDGPPWWISADQLHDQPPTSAKDLLDQLIKAESEHEFFTEGREAWLAFTSFVLASTSRPASVGGACGWGVGTATPDSVAVSLSTGGLLAAGADEARSELVALAQEWRAADRPDLSKLALSFLPHDEGWAVRPQLHSRV